MIILSNKMKNNNLKYYQLNIIILMNTLMINMNNNNIN